MKKVISIVGARPQFIKLAPFSKAVRKKYKEVILHTGQHYDRNMSGSFFEELEIPEPDYNLEIGSGSHAVQTGQMLIALEKVVLDEKPDALVVFGDTNSTLAGALVAGKLRIPVAHVEAGLRSFNRAMPEEINRIVADQACDLLFAPTQTAENQLIREGMQNKTRLAGDIMIDTLQMSLDKAEQQSRILEKFDLTLKNYLLLTLHRPYTVDAAAVMKPILQAIGRIGKRVVFPVHPRTRKMITSFRLRHQQNILLIEPQGYLDFIMLQKHAQKILTDSGGIQKEAYLLGIPCITLRPETEWVETVEAGWNRIVGHDPAKLTEAIGTFEPDSHRPVVFGTFPVAEKMVAALTDLMGRGGK
jgi:UDP-GlcNAc3NAcA epimerase